ncbi:hypothetical protein HGRIS_014839 [Hohenbuehelia grisea]|uniref:Uncharacterized protein n=1 Tax=Hohenbuehelia grisea TaxID=104357 RepID=A0ABR3IQW9_9AGAR
MPAEIMNDVESALSEGGMPRLATRNVEEGSGYSVELNGRAYEFKEIRRAPPEVYMTRRYQAWSHTDPAFCRWAFSVCVHRKVDTAWEMDPPQHYATRSAKATHKRKLSVQRDLPGGGANFVDMRLGVVVKQATGTAICFQPEEFHGMTLECGASNHAITFAFSRRIADALAELRDRGTGGGVIIESGEGAGEGPHPMMNEMTTGEANEPLPFACVA